MSMVSGRFPWSRSGRPNLDQGDRISVSPIPVHLPPRLEDAYVCGFGIGFDRAITKNEKEKGEKTQSSKMEMCAL